MFQVAVLDSARTDKVKDVSSNGVENRFKNYSSLILFPN